ncbi:MAG: hypothetical protein JWQ30_1080 [Sediminibacterium sp.]|nr:hypothetical protein [Sediminibacterium sp.]
MYENRFTMPIKIIITGATGFVGEGVLLECLQHADVDEVLMVNRKHVNLQHSKLKELIVPDFFTMDIYSEQLKGYDACFYCAGISSAGMNEKDYTHITYDTTIAFAKNLLKVNTGLTFCFISGSHTDSSEKGKIMWARVKGKTENALIGLPFKHEYNFRPGGMIPTAGQKNAKPLYKFIVKLMALLLPKRVSTLKEVGLAMINATLKGYPLQILEIKDIKELAG